MNTDIEEAQKTKAMLYNIDNEDGNIEERRKYIFDRYLLF